jgi:hypothetical protein
LTNRAKLVLEALPTNLANRQPGTDNEAPLIRSYQPAPGEHWVIVPSFNQRAGLLSARSIIEGQHRAQGGSALSLLSQLE